MLRSKLGPNGGAWLNIRVPNSKILKLKRLMPVGTPIWIHD